MEEKNGQQIVAKNEQGEVIGYIAGMENIHPGYFTISELFVNKENQSQWIGGQLLTRAINLAKSQKLKGVVLEVDFKDIREESLYEEIGFTKAENVHLKTGVSYIYYL